MYRIRRTKETYHYLKIGKVVDFFKKTNTYLLLTGDRQLRYFKTERKFPISANCTDRQLAAYVVYCDLDWGQKSNRVHIIGRLLDFKFIEHYPADIYTLGLDLENEDLPNLAIIHVKETNFIGPRFYICFKNGRDVDEEKNEKLLIETITPVEGFACELLVTIYGKPLQKFYIANEEQYREAIVNMTAFVEKLDIKEIAESAKVDYYNTSAEWHFSRDVGYVREGETGYKTVYKYLDCYLKTIFPVEKKKCRWASESFLCPVPEPSKEQKDALRSKADRLNVTIKERALLSLDNYDKDLHIAYLVREQVLKNSTFQDTEMESFKLIRESVKKYWGASFLYRIRYVIYNDQENCMYWINMFNTIFSPIRPGSLRWRHRRCIL